MMAELFSRKKFRYSAINCNFFIFILTSEKTEKNNLEKKMNYLILAEYHDFRESVPSQKTKNIPWVENVTHVYYSYRNNEIQKRRERGSADIS